MNASAEPKPTSQASRRAALKALGRVLRDGQSLASVREQLYLSLPERRDRAFAMRLVQGVLRWRWKLDALLQQLMDKPLRNKEHDIRQLLWMALYEIDDMDTPDYAAVDEAVKLARKLGKRWAEGLVNAVLRRFIRERETLVAALDAEASLSHPDWLREAIAASWPDDWQRVLANNNAIAATHLRVNPMRCSVEAMQQALESASVPCRQHPLDADILVIDSTDVTALPGYDEGWFSVQDAAAQRLPEVLRAQPGQRVLDLCAAPGGKACHLIESLRGDVELVAVDIDAARLQRVQDNLERLGLTAELLQADAAADGWYRGEPFDRIVVDAPCSATGVIRRHPDIKSLRRPEDIAALVELQAKILDKAWRLLLPGGELVYVTCSVLEQENSAQIARFLERHDDARELSVERDWGRACVHGRQLLPGDDDSDGFYYARLSKTA